MKEFVSYRQKKTAILTDAVSTSTKIFYAYEKTSSHERLSLVNLACSFVVDDQSCCYDCCAEHSHYCYCIKCCHHCVTLSLL